MYYVPSKANLSIIYTSGSQPEVRVALGVYDMISRGMWKKFSNGGKSE